MAKSKYTVDQLLKLDFEDFNRLSARELRAATSVLASAANKRISRASKAGVSSSAIRYAERARPAGFGTKGKNLNQLREEFSIARGFLSARGGTIRGAREIEKRTVNTLKNSYGINITNEQARKFFRAFENLKDIDPNFIAYKYELLKVVADELSDNPNVEDLTNRLLEAFNDMELENIETDEWYDVF